MAMHLAHSKAKIILAQVSLGFDPRTYTAFIGEIAEIMVFDRVYLKLTRND